MDKIPGLYISENVFSDDEHDRYFDLLENEKGNIIYGIHKSLERGWKFLPVRKRTIDDYLGPYPLWIEEIWSKISNRLPDLKNINRMPDEILINKYEIGDGSKLEM